MEKTKAPVHWSFYHIHRANQVPCGKHSASGSFTIDVINYKAHRTKLVHMKNENVPERRGRTKHSLVLFSQQRWKVCFYHKMLVKNDMSSEWLKKLLPHWPPFKNTIVTFMLTNLFHHIWQTVRISSECTIAHAFSTVTNGLTTWAMMNLDSLKQGWNITWNSPENAGRQSCRINSVFMKNFITWPCTYYINNCCYKRFLKETRRTPMQLENWPRQCAEKDCLAVSPKGEMISLTSP